jgi:hypothetical protein
VQWREDVLGKGPVEIEPAAGELNHKSGVESHARVADFRYLKMDRTWIARTQSFSDIGCQVARQVTQPKTIGGRDDNRFTVEQIAVFGNESKGLTFGKTQDCLGCAIRYWTPRTKNLQVALSVDGLRSG